MNTYVMTDAGRLAHLDLMAEDLSRLQEERDAARWAAQTIRELKAKPFVKHWRSDEHS